MSREERLSTILSHTHEDTDTDAIWKVFEEFQAEVKELKEILDAHKKLDETTDCLLCPDKLMCGRYGCEEARKVITDYYKTQDNE